MLASYKGQSFEISLQFVVFGFCSQATFWEADIIQTNQGYCSVNTHGLKETVFPWWSQWMYKLSYEDKVLGMVK